MTVTYHEIKWYVKNHGWVVVPIDANGNRKTPCGPGWKYTTIDTCTQVFKYAVENYNVGGVAIITGDKSNLFVLDIDKPKEQEFSGFDLWNIYTEKHGEPNTIAVISGGGGLHWYFKMSDRLREFKSTSRSIKFDGKNVSWDIKANGGLIIAPPSMHASGNRYQWKNHAGEVELADMPDSLYEFLVGLQSSAKTTHKPQDLRTILASIKPEIKYSLQDVKDRLALLSSDGGGSYDGWLKRICILKRCSVDLDADKECWQLAYNMSKHDPKFSVEGLNEKWFSFDYRETGYGFRTLDNLARESNPLAHYELGRLNTVVDANNVDVDVTVEAYTPTFDARDKFSVLDFILKYGKLPVIKKENLKPIVLQLIKDLKRVAIVVKGCTTRVVVKDSYKNPFAIEFLDKFMFDNRKYSIKISVKDENDKETVLSMPIFHPLERDMDDWCNVITNVPCSPGKRPIVGPKEFNIFPGFKAGIVHVVEIEMIQPILDHIKLVWGDNSEENYHYILSWLAHLVQHPDQKARIAIVLISKLQQIGKGLIIDFLITWVFGIIATKTANINDITGRFNSLLMGKILINLDEASNSTGDQYHQVFDVMKNLISESETRIEVKGKEVEIMPSHTSFIITSNNDHPIKIEQGDARYAIFKCNDSLAGNFTYFNQLSEKIMNQEVGNHFLTFLSTYKYELSDLRKIPKTEVRQNLISSSMPKMDVFAAALREQEIDGIKLGFNTSAILYTVYKTWCENNGYKPSNVAVFGREMKSSGFVDKREYIGSKQIRGFIIA